MLRPHVPYLIASFHRVVAAASFLLRGGPGLTSVLLDSSSRDGSLRSLTPSSGAPTVAVRAGKKKRTVLKELHPMTRPVFYQDCQALPTTAR